ncbi:hypothetical protein IZY60_13920 [Lutibacter sp. B2]|nr:hypothetical protein [Lutibacter sp. B2]
MDNNEVYEKFKKAQRYRTWSTCLFISSPVVGFLFQNIVGYLLIGIIFMIAIYFDMQYKCPICNKKFDTRVNPSGLKYCSHCSARLQE